MAIPNAESSPYYSPKGHHALDPHHVYPQNYHPHACGRDPRLCTYPSKICDHERAIKRNGTYHRFCEYHRQQANLNQQRWAKRKQTMNQVCNYYHNPVPMMMMMMDHNTAVAWAREPAVPTALGAPAAAGAGRYCDNLYGASPYSHHYPIESSYGQYYHEPTPVNHGTHPMHAEAAFYVPRFAASGPWTSHSDHLPPVAGPFLR